MAKSVQKQANDIFRSKVIERIKECFEKQGVEVADGEQVLQVASNKLAFMFVNSAGSDEWVEITVSIPLGSREDKNPYDGFERAKEYAEKVEKSEKLAKERAERKAQMIAFDKKKREIAQKAKANQEK